MFIELSVVDGWFVNEQHAAVMTTVQLQLHTHVIAHLWYPTSFSVEGAIITHVPANSHS